jgi:hypothetical protein
MNPFTTQTILPSVKKLSGSKVMNSVPLLITAQGFTYSPNWVLLLEISIRATLVRTESPSWGLWYVQSYIFCFDGLLNSIVNRLREYLGDGFWRGWVPRY